MVTFSTVVLEECRDGRHEVVFVLARLYFLQLTMECFLFSQQESSTTVHMIPENSDFNAHDCVHAVLKAWRTQTWLFQPTSLKVVILLVAEITLSCIGENPLLLEMACEKSLFDPSLLAFTSGHLTQN